MTRILEWPIEKSHELVKQTVQCAVTAAKESKKRIYIGGSIGPYSGELACPSGPYNPEYLKSLSIEQLAAWLEPLYQDLNSNDDIDFLAIETVPGLKEAAAHFSLLMSKYRKNAYLGMVQYCFNFSRIPNFTKSRIFFKFLDCRRFKIFKNLHLWDKKVSSNFEGFLILLPKTY